MRILIAASGSNDGASDPVAAAASIPWPLGTVFRVLTIAENVHPPVLQLLEGARDVSDVQHTADNVAANTVASAVAQLQSRGFDADGVSPEGDPKSMIADYGLGTILDGPVWGHELDLEDQRLASRQHPFLQPFQSL